MHWDIRYLVCVLELFFIYNDVVFYLNLIDKKTRQIVIQIIE